MRFADYIFNRMSGCFDSTQKRHHAVRRVTTTGHDDGRSVPPIAYLLQLSAKHAVDAPHPQRSSEESAKKIIGVATAFADALDIRSVSAFEGMFQNHRTLAPYLREIVLFDGTYSLVQGRLGDVHVSLNASSTGFQPDRCSRARDARYRNSPPSQAPLLSLLLFGDRD